LFFEQFDLRFGSGLDGVSIFLRPYLLGVKNELFPSVRILRLRLVAHYVLGQLPGGEFGFAHEMKVLGQVRCLPLDQGCQERHVGRFSPAGRQVQADLLQLLPQQPTAVLALGPEKNRVFSQGASKRRIL